MHDNPYQAPQATSDGAKRERPNDGKLWSLVLFLSLLASFVVLLFWLRGV
jgi:hypothetical protein